MTAVTVEPWSWDRLRSASMEVRNAGLVALWEARKRAMHSLSLYMLRSPDVAADAVQEALRRFIQSLRRSQPDCGAPTYLMSILHHVCVDYLRRDRVTLNFGERISDRPEALPAGGERPLTAITLREEQAALRDALIRLPAAPRAAVMLRFACGLDIDDCAQILRMRRNTFEVCLHRAVRRLAEMVNTGSESK